MYINLHTISPSGNRTFHKLCRGFAVVEASANQGTNGPVNAHLISWPSKAENIQNLENTIVKGLSNIKPFRIRIILKIILLKDETKNILNELGP